MGDTGRRGPHQHLGFEGNFVRTISAKARLDVSADDGAVSVSRLSQNRAFDTARPGKGCSGRRNTAPIDSKSFAIDFSIFLSCFRFPGYSRPAAKSSHLFGIDAALVDFHSVHGERRHMVVERVGNVGLLRLLDHLDPDGSQLRMGSFHLFDVAQRPFARRGTISDRKVYRFHKLYGLK